MALNETEAQCNSYIKYMKKSAGNGLTYYRTFLHRCNNVPTSSLLLFLKIHATIKTLKCSAKTTTCNINRLTAQTGYCCCPWNKIPKMLVAGKIFRFKSSIIPVNSIDTSGIVATWIAVALVDVDLAVWSRSAGLAETLVAVHQILTYAAELAGIWFTFINLRLAQVARVSGMAHAGEGVLAVDTFTMVARRRGTVIDVCFARYSYKLNWGIDKCNIGRP